MGGAPLGQGPLVAFAAVFFLMYRPLRDLGDSRTAVERGAQALAALREVCTDDTALHSLGRPRTPATPSPGARRGRRRACRWTDLSVVRGAHTTPKTSLEAAPGELVAVVGPTGSGKTSLLRALLGLERPSTGAVRYGDLDLTCAGVGPGERPFAWVPQEPAILGGTLDENVSLGLPEEVERGRDGTAPTRSP